MFLEINSEENRSKNKIIRTKIIKFRKDIRHGENENQQKDSAGLEEGETAQNQEQNK